MNMPEADRKPYEAPTIEPLGSVWERTGAGTIAGGDLASQQISV